MVLLVHWWNGRFEHAARRDVFVRRDADAFTVELRSGGPRGTTTSTTHPTAWAAVTAARAHLVPLADWSDVTDAHRHAHPER
ncbi:hypothetical protein GCM10010123_46060 [Pilimelia anulata]|uniref:Uncharacterized protein n=1 Tax=Pilimelia anulata TaxID=53371 RepID=A0A8J3BC40_9ACTN|nr:hypothetical protein [Pilimelia anulata]GGK10923.1 hypothetical protein GCM10010123_46060 [Pilimelia anulata]